VLNFIAIDLQLYKIFKITRVSFFSGHSVVPTHGSRGGGLVIIIKKKDNNIYFYCLCVYVKSTYTDILVL